MDLILNKYRNEKEGTHSRVFVSHINSKLKNWVQLIIVSEVHQQDID